MKNSQLLSKNFRFLVFLFILATLISMMYLYYHHNFYVNNKEAEITMTEVAEASLPHYMSDQPNAADEDQGNRFGLGVVGFIFDNYLFTTFDNDIVRINLSAQELESQEHLTLDFWNNLLQDERFTARIPYHINSDTNDEIVLSNGHGSIIAQRIINLGNNGEEGFTGHGIMLQKDSGLYIDIINDQGLHSLYHLAYGGANPLLLSDQISGQHPLITEKRIGDEIAILFTYRDRRLEDKFPEETHNAYLYLPTEKKFVVLFEFYDFIGQDAQGNIYAREPNSGKIYQWQLDMSDHDVRINYWSTALPKSMNAHSWDSDYRLVNNTMYFLSDDKKMYIISLENREMKLLYNFNDFFTNHKYNIDNWYVERIKDGRFGICLCSFEHMNENNQNSFYDLNTREFIEDIDDCFGHAHAWFCG
ncbi:hypothetical protein IJJ08_01120 [bacterium]|nr:hypothetical protein [bacterium]